jgi:hypothetical protein
MKRIVLIALSVLFFAGGADARIWRVNNTPGVTADFTTAQAAHNAASAGDTIHLEPSANSYGNLSSSKRLTWLGTGVFLNLYPDFQYSSVTGRISSCEFYAGSEGSVFSAYTDNCYLGASNINITRAYINGQLSIAGTSNNVISQSYITSALSITGSGSNNVITNCIVSYISASTTLTSTIITNNVLSYNSPTTFDFNNAIFQNNIIKGGVPTYRFSNSNVSYNMSAGSNLPAGNNNLTGVNMATVFENNSGTADKDFLLRAGSPAIGAGFGGIDLGVYGGSTPFKPALQPAIPAITNLSTPSSSGNNIIQVTFSAKSNN